MPVENSDTWPAARAAALERDGARCSVARLLGGACSPPPLHVHHLVPRREGGTDALDNLVTSCARHHPVLEALREAVRAISRRNEDEAERRRRRARHFVAVVGRGYHERDLRDELRQRFRLDEDELEDALAAAA